MSGCGGVSGSGERLQITGNLEERSDLILELLIIE